MDHQQATASPNQLDLEQAQGLVQKSHSPIGRRQVIQNVAVKDKDGHDGLRVLQGLGQGRVVLQAQVTPQPDQLAW
jgi:hypothetical protein